MTISPMYSTLESNHRSSKLELYDVLKSEDSEFHKATFRAALTHRGVSSLDRGSHRQGRMHRVGPSVHMAHFA